MMSRSMQAAVLVAVTFSLACGNGEGGPVEHVVRDSAGITISEYPGTALDGPPSLALSVEPLAAIRGADNPDFDVSNLTGRFTPDGGFLAVSFRPVMVVLFDSQGRFARQLGREGGGPGEYQMPFGVEISGDTAMAMDAAQSRWVRFLLDGTVLSDLRMPLAGGILGIGLPVGVLSDGAFISMVPGASPGVIDTISGSTFRIEDKVNIWREGASGFTELLVLPGAEMAKRTIDLPGSGNSTIPVPVALGAASVVVAGGESIWSTTGDRFELVERDGSGTVRRIVRVSREPTRVTPGYREEYLAKRRDQVNRTMSANPSLQAARDGALRVIEQMPFAERIAPIGRMIRGTDGSLWVAEVTLEQDAPTRWTVISADGELVGTLDLPAGRLLAVHGDRILQRVEDPDTGDVDLVIWGVTGGG